jgi:hypothetical protein
MDDLEKIISSDVTSVWSGFVDSLKKKTSKAIIPAILFFVLAVMLTILTRIPHFIFFYVIILFTLIVILWNTAVKDFLKHFASHMGYEYNSSGDMSSVEGHIFQYGSNPEIEKIVSGEFFGKDTRLFIFKTTVGSGKHKHEEFYSILEITFDALLPEIILNNKKSVFGFGFTLASLDNERKLVLEGDFYKYFNLYVAKEYELEAMQIFTPEVMQIFIDKAGKISAEMYKNKVYLYFPGIITKKEQMVTIYGLAKEIILQLSHVFFRIKDDVEDMSKYAKLT